MTFKFKLIMTFVFYGLSLVILSQAVIYKVNETNIKEASIKKAVEVFENKNELFKFYIKDTNLKLLAIKNSTIFKEYLSTKQKRDSLESFFLDIASTTDNIMQLRYIDKDGMEVVRIDRDYYMGDAYVIDKTKLQDKSSRYYFKETMLSDVDNFWYSKLDLNIEYGKIEKPMKPVLRVATPIEDGDEIKGILIINIFMKNFLEQLVDNPFNDIYLVNGNGYILVESSHQACWSEYIERNETFSSQPSEAIYVKKIFLENGENISMIVKPKGEHIQGELEAIVYELFFILLGFILLSVPLSYFFSNISTRLKEEVDRQKAQQDTLLSLFDLGDVVLFKWNNDAQWSVNHVSKSVEKLLGYTKDDFVNHTVSYVECVHRDDLDFVTQELEKAIRDRVYFFEHKPYRVLTKDKKVKWILDSTVIMRDTSGKIINFIGYLNDITELKNNEILLQKLSTTDQLTQIYNRMYLDDMVQTQYYRFNRSSEVCSVILVDIDHFKTVNDRHGHLVGDKVLIEFANLLRNSIRSSDSVGRWGGEEFLIVLPHTALKEALILAEKIRVIVENNIFTAVKHKTASFGVAYFTNGMSVEMLTDKADIALYKSKNDGRNRVSTIQEVE